MKTIRLLIALSILTSTCPAMITKRTTEDYEAAIAARTEAKEKYFAELKAKKEALRQKRMRTPMSSAEVEARRQHKIEVARRAVIQATVALEKADARKDKLLKTYQDALEALDNARDPIVFFDTDEDDSEQEEDDDKLAPQSSGDSDGPLFHGIPLKYWQFVSMWHRMSHSEKIHWVTTVGQRDLDLIQRYDNEWYRENIK